MRDQDGEIQRPGQSLTLKMGDAGPQHQMVVKVRDEEQRGGYERRDHHPLVGLAAATLDEIKPGADQNSAAAVQNGIESRIESQAYLHQVAGLVVRRLATRNEKANMIKVNSASTAKLTPSGRPVEAEPGKSSERNASVP